MKPSNNFGILALVFAIKADYDTINQGDVLEMPNVKKELENGFAFTVINKTKQF